MRILKNWFARKADWSDEELIRHYKAEGDSRYLGELFCRYASWLSAIALRITKNQQDAEDLIMDSYEIMAKDLLTAEVRNFQPWAGAVVRHRALKMVRSRKEGDPVMEERLESEEDELEGKKEIEQMLTMLPELKPDQRKCVELFYLQSKSYKDIVDETGIEMKKVKSHIQNGKRNLKILMLKEQEASEE